MNLNDWSLVGGKDHPHASLIASDVERTTLYMVPARLRRKSSLAGGNHELLTAKVSWVTFEEPFGIRLKDGDAMSFEDGDVILVLISTETSTSRGCTNGHAQLLATQIAPGVWAEQHPLP